MNVRRILRSLSAGFLLLGGISHADPIDINSPLQISLDIKKAVALEFKTQSDKYYQIEFSSDLGAWTNEGNSFKGTGGPVTKTVDGHGLDKAFYRVRDDGDPKNVAVGNPSRVWVAETANRTGFTTYTNTAPYEIQIYAEVTQVTAWQIETRASDNSTWMVVGRTVANGNLFPDGQQSISATIPAGWQYHYVNNSTFTYSGIIIWNELK